MKKPQHARQSIELDRLRPTQIAVGMYQVKEKRANLRLLTKRPSELVEFIVTHPILVVLGPAGKVYVIDHHHFGLALIKEKFETAPMSIAADLSELKTDEFWAEMAKRKYVYPFDGHGVERTIQDIPKDLRDLEDDPYRSLAGFVRNAGGFSKVETPFAEFLWAEYFRPRIPRAKVKKNFDKALKEALKLAVLPDAKSLPGYHGKT